MGARGSKRLLCNFLLQIFFHLQCIVSAVDIYDKAFIKECLDVHNFYRSRVNPSASNMLYMSWDRILSEVAHEWSKKCIFDHNTDLKVPQKLHPVFKTLGENIYVTTGSNLNVTSATKSWYNEVADYNYGSNQCSRICGHYTQLVWATSYKVGCAVHTCPSGIFHFNSRLSTIFVCDYGPPGNYPQQPYLTGKECSKCYMDRCENKLCRNKTREMTDSDSLCNEFCITVLLLRPLSLVAIFVGVYILQQSYPNMFAYL
uniref:Glioma pathogenesis-related protein 1-like protein n=1 Tax=Callorhinchus milii TaxID=7868 RepID=V9KU21_CALMI